jgi:hypothetical protein
LQLTAFLVGIAHVAAAEPADEPLATAGLRVYADDDHVTVVSPSAAVQVATSPRTVLAADTTVDAVSAASVDVVTSASPRTVREQRVELGIATTYRVPQGPTWFTLGARGSHEHDYDALRARLAVRRDLAQRNTTLDVEYVFGADRAGSARDPGFREGRTSHELEVTASQLLGPRTVADVVADVTVADGYHANPYRDVLVDQMSWPEPLRVPEQTPRRRASIALAGRVRRALADRWYAAATYRYYRDDWEIASHTTTAELRREVASRWLVGASVRGYVQDGASFYRARYDDRDGVPALRTRDRTLGPMRSAHAAVTVDSALDEAARWHLIGSLGVLRWWFPEFPAQADRDAVIVHASVSTSW